MSRKFTLITTLFLAIVLSACTKVDTVQKPTAVTLAPAKSTKEECLKGCVILWKGNSANSTKTDEEMNKYCNSLCDSGQGIQNLDVSSCDKSEGAYKDACYSAIAKKTNDSALCDKISSQIMQSSCFSTIAKNLNDKTICEKVPNGAMKKACLEK